VRSAGASADHDHLSVAAWIVAVMNNGVPDVICLLGIMTVIVDVVLSWKRMDRTIHFKMGRRQAIFNRHTHESKLRKVLCNAKFHEAAAVATSVNHDRYAMSLTVIDVVHRSSNAHAIYDLVGFNYAGWRRWGLRFGEISSAHERRKENGFLHFNPFSDGFSLLTLNR
jgi:hypothetical protein